MVEIQAEIDKKLAELEKLQQEVKKLEQIDPDKALAVMIHDAKCHSNHTDGCGWYYEMTNNVDNWTGYSHKEYITKSRM